MKSGRLEEGQLMGLKVHWFQHAPFEGLGSIAGMAGSQSRAGQLDAFFRAPRPPEP